MNPLVVSVNTLSTRYYEIPEVGSPTQEIFLATAVYERALEAVRAEFSRDVYGCLPFGARAAVDSLLAWTEEASDRAINGWGDPDEDWRHFERAIIGLYFLVARTEVADYDPNVCHQETA